MKTYIYVLESDPNIDNARRYPKNPRRESDRVFVQAHRRYIFNRTLTHSSCRVSTTARAALNIVHRMRLHE